jgi:hypothetical protein
MHLCTAWMKTACIWSLRARFISSICFVARSGWTCSNQLCCDWPGTTAGNWRLGLCSAPIIISSDVPTGTATTLRKFLRHLHADTAREVNRLDEQQSRQVWHNYWESCLTFERLVSRATQLRASKRGTSWSGGCGQSVCMVFGRVVRAGGGAGDGEDRLRVQDRSD